MPAASTTRNAFIAPFALFIALLPVADLMNGSAKYWIFPFQTLLCGAVLIHYWQNYSFTFPAKPAFTLSVAVIVLLVWISPQEWFGFSKRLTGFNPVIFKYRPLFYFATLGFRFLRLVIVVPLAEEIFWRGFLLRYLISEEFESVPFGAFTWQSYTLVTFGFCLEHTLPDWPAGLVAGGLFNLVAYRTRSLGSCVVAHAFTNLLLGIYIMRTGQWGYW